MGSTAVTIWKALATAINADHSVSGTHDLSATDAVRRGRFMQPGVVPSVWIAAPVITTEPDSQIGDFKRLAVFDVVGYVAGTSRAPSSRADQALELAHDVMTAVENASRTAGGSLRSTAYNISCELTGFDGDEGDLAPGYGVCIGTIEIEYTKDRGI